MSYLYLYTFFIQNLPSIRVIGIVSPTDIIAMNKFKTYGNHKTRVNCNQLLVDKHIIGEK